MANIDEAKYKEIVKWLKSNGFKHVECYDSIVDHNGYVDSITYYERKNNKKLERISSRTFCFPKRKVNKFSVYEFNLLVDNYEDKFVEMDLCLRFNDTTLNTIDIANDLGINGLKFKLWDSGSYKTNSFGGDMFYIIKGRNKPTNPV